MLKKILAFLACLVGFVVVISLPSCTLDNPFSSDSPVETRLAPDASFSWDNNGLFVLFRNTSTCNGELCSEDDNRITYEWTFGDLSSLSNDYEPFHEYQSAGTYRVILRINDRGQTDVAEALIQVP